MHYREQLNQNATGIIIYSFAFRILTDKNEKSKFFSESGK
jgi:hypothetical protein